MTRCLFWIFQALYFVLPFLMAWSCISLFSVYFAYYDIGTNPGANNGFLLYFVAPIMVMLFFIVAVVARYIAGRLQWSARRTLLSGLTALVAVEVAVFLIGVSSYADYPTETPQDLKKFLIYYCHYLVGH